MTKPAYINDRMIKSSGFPRLWAASPFIYSMIVPIILLHAWTQLYQHICFRLYGVPLVDQSRFIRDQRWKLKYLTWTEKINCLYCGYANGVLAFARMVAAETEKQWCPIKDKLAAIQADEKYHLDLEHRRDFAAYDDELALQVLTAGACESEINREMKKAYDDDKPLSETSA